MAKLYLISRDKKSRGDWELLLGKGRVRLTDPQGYVAVEFNHDEAAKRFQLPSFWMSVKDLGINTDDRKVLWFHPDKEAIQEIQRYMGYSLAAQGHEAISSTQWKGWSMIIGGILLLLAAVGLGILLIGQANDPSADHRYGRYRVAPPILCGIFGGSLIGAGIRSLARARRAATEWDIDDEEEDERE